MKRISYFTMLGMLLFAASCTKCYDCTRDPGHGAAVQTEQVCSATEADDQSSLGWTCK